MTLRWLRLHARLALAWSKKQRQHVRRSEAAKGKRNGRKAKVIPA